MTKPSETLKRGREAIDRITRKIRVPDCKIPEGKDVWMLDRAMELAEAWAADRLPKSEGAGRGGSSSADERSKKTEESSVERRAAEAAYRFRRIPALVEELDLIARDVTYLTTITEERPKVPEETLAGCRSCARAGINEPVYHKSKVSGLCRWCAEKLDEYEVLPVEAVSIRHSRGPKAATVWLQANADRKGDDLPPSCANRATVHGFDVRCYRPMGHDAECFGVGIDGKRVTWQIIGAVAVIG